MLVVVHSEQLSVLVVPLRAAHPQVSSARGRRRWRHWVRWQRWWKCAWACARGT